MFAVIGWLSVAFAAKPGSILVTVTVQTEPQRTATSVSSVPGAKVKHNGTGVEKITNKSGQTEFLFSELKPKGQTTQYEFSAAKSIAGFKKLSGQDKKNYNLTPNATDILLTVELDTRGLTSTDFSKVKAELANPTPETLTTPQRPIDGTKPPSGGALPAPATKGPVKGEISPDLRGPKTIEQVAEPDVKIITLADRLDPRKPEGKAIGDIWRTILNITNGAAILVFLVMGFATIFSVQVDTYGVKKALPNVIIALILANFSLFITRMVVDVSNILIVSIVNSFEGGSKGLVNELLKAFINGGRDGLGSLITSFTSGTGFNAPTAIKAIVFVSAIYTAGGFLILGAVLLAALAIIVPSVFILILAVLFYVRTYVILALAAVSPLAFISFALPVTQVLFRQWWTQLVRWAMLGPIAFFMIWLGIKFSEAFQGTGFEFGIYLVALTMLYLAISLPFKMGGVITANVGKYLGKPLRQAAGFGAKWYGRTGEVMSGAISQKAVQIASRGRWQGAPVTLPGIFRGWGKQADYLYQYEAGKGTEVGRMLRDIATSGVRAIPRLSPRAAFRAAFATSADRTQILAQEHLKPLVQGMVGSGKSAKDLKDLAQMFMNAGEHENAAAAIAANKIIGGKDSYTEKELQKLGEKHSWLRGPIGTSAMAIAHQEAAKNPSNVTPVVQPFREDQTNKDDAELDRDLANWYSRKIDTTSASQRTDTILQMVDVAQQRGEALGLAHPLVRAILSMARRGTTIAPQINTKLNINFDQVANVVNELEAAGMPEFGKVLSGQSFDDITGTRAFVQANASLEQALNTLRQDLFSAINQRLTDTGYSVQRPADVAPIRNALDSMTGLTDKAKAELRDLISRSDAMRTAGDGATQVYGQLYDRYKHYVDVAERQQAKP